MKKTYIVTMGCKMSEIIHTEDGKFMISWVGGEYKVVTCPKFSFSVEGLPQALNDAAVLCALNDCIYSINIKESQGSMLKY